MSNARLVARNEENDADDFLFSVDGVLSGRLGAVDHRLARFDAAADMPADITSAANVSADVVKMNTFSSTARRVQIIWHGPPATYNGTAGAGPIAIGARVTVNAPDDITAEQRLLYTDLTGGGTSTAGAADAFMVSPSDPMVEAFLNESLLRIDAIGIPCGTTPTTIVPAFLEVRVIG